MKAIPKPYGQRSNNAPELNRSSSCFSTHGTKQGIVRAHGPRGIRGSSQEKISGDHVEEQ